MKEYGLEPFVLEDIRKVLRRFPEVLSASLYGSRAKGTFKETSDIDIAVHAPKMTNQEFARLCFEIDELSLVFKIDVVLFENIKNDDLLAKIRREEKFFYRKA